MSRSKEMKEKFDKIRELQEQRDRHERDARGQNDELEAILEASRRAHGEDAPGLVSSSRLSGPGYGDARRNRPSDPENAYDASFNAARFASPNAFSRNRSAPTRVPDGSPQALTQSTTNSAAVAAGSPPPAAPVVREPAAKAPPPSPPPRPEHTVTMTVKAFAPTNTEVTQVVRKRSTPLKPRREPPAVPHPSLQTSAKAAMPSEDTPIAGMAAEGTATVPGRPMTPDPTATVTVPNAISHNTVTQRVTFRPQHNTSSRKVTNPAYGIDQNVSHDELHSDTVPTGSPRARGPYEDTTPGMRDITTPGMGSDDTIPGRELTSPGSDTDPRSEVTIPGLPGYEATSPGMREVTTPGAPPLQARPPAFEDSVVLKREPAPREITAPGFKQIVAKPVQPPPPPEDRDTSPGPERVSPIEATAVFAERPEDDEVVEESIVDDEQYKKVREMDALIARFAADVEVKTGRGRENTFLRKRSEIQGAPPDEYPDEHTQPRHKKIEIRRETTEVIPRPLPPRKRR